MSLLLILVASNAVKAQTLDNAKNAYFHRDYQQVKNIIKKLKIEKAEDKLLMAELALLAIAVEVKNDVDDADDDLETFIENNPNNASFYYMAGLLWNDLAKNASVFSKMSKYKHYVKAMVKAAKLAPNNERYQLEAAKAYGQPSMMGGDSDKQKPIVDKLMVNNSAFAQMAMMDYLQNTQDKKHAFIFIRDVSIAFKNNIEVMERAAQLLWTFDKKQQAGALFTAVCLLPAGKYEAFEKWSDACLLSAEFSLDGSVDKTAGLLSIERLIKLTKVDDKYTQYAKLTRKKLSTSH